MKEETAIEYCERTYPEMMDEFKKVQVEMYETFCKKQRNYGPGNISVGSSLETKEDIEKGIKGKTPRPDYKSYKPNTYHDLDLGPDRIPVYVPIKERKD